MTCPACASAVPAGAKFCPACGGAIRAGSAGEDSLRDRLQAAVGDTFAIEKLLGRGGMGAVYLAREPSLDRLVAIKVLPPERAESIELKERFRREARTAAQLSHPHIVPLLTFGEESGLMYFVMGYVEGETLSGRLRREGRLEIGEAVRVLSELAQALSYAHGRSVIHRDVKPENILLEEPKSVVRLTDFGVAKGIAAKAPASLTSEGAVIGTPLYMSPEQASGRADVDARSDIYSMGVVAFVLFAGRPPFEGRSAHEILRQHLTSDPPRLRDSSPGIPGAIDDAVRKCLAKDPASRFRDASDFANALAAAGDSWWGALLRRARPAASASLKSVEATIVGTSSTPTPSTTLEFRASINELARSLDDAELGARVGATANRLASEVETIDTRLIGLQLAGDPVELRRAQKKLATLREIADPPKEVASAIEALVQFTAATQEAARSTEAARSERASAFAALRKLYTAARKARSGSDVAALGDLERICRSAVSEGATQVRGDESQTKSK